jgi:pyruvate-formate lyase-activating enzyme
MMPSESEPLRTEVVVPGTEDAATRGSLNGGRAKFSDANVTAKGEARGEVPFNTLKTVWFNTGTLCNISCQGCYIESSPRNDRLAYLSRDEVRRFLDEAEFLSDEELEIGFTGGEPFMNPDVIGMLEDSLLKGFRVLVLTNAMLPMQHHKPRLLELGRMFSGLLSIRVSIDHYEKAGHEKVRGPRTWDPALDGLRWLAQEGFNLTIAGRLMWDESESAIRAGYAALFAREGIPVAAHDPNRLVLFPEMKAGVDVPEISQSCWAILGRSPSDMMCASSRMVVKRKGAMQPVVVSCTILPYEAAFEMGATLSQARMPVKLNHPNCARFCVLGGASCSHKT